jgi:DNA invertase Pin-like site-specific DNA recombinase
MSIQKQKKVFFYARRSTEKDKQTTISLEIQLMEMEIYAKKKNYEVIWIFSEIKTSHTSWVRQDFNDMLNEVTRRNILNNGEHVDIIIVYMVSRLARNHEEWDTLASLMRKEIVLFESLKEEIKNTNAGKKAFRDLINSAVTESDEKSTEAIKYMDITYSKWKFARKLPFWYKAVEENKIIKIKWDTEDRKDEIITKIFSYYSLGSYTHETLTKKLNEEWFYKFREFRTKNKEWVNEIIMEKSELMDSDIENVLNNPMYMWKVEAVYWKRRFLTDDGVQWLTAEELIYFSDKYPLIQPINWTITIDYTKFFKNVFTAYTDEKTFKLCKGVSEWRWRPLGESDKDAHAWRGILRCNCEEHIKESPYTFKRYTSEWKDRETKKGKVTYIYYKCTQPLCTNRNVSEIQIEEEVKPILKKISFTDSEIKSFTKIFIAKLTNDKDDKDTSIQKIKHKIKILEITADNLYEKFGITSSPIMIARIEKDMEATELEKIQLQKDLLELENKPVKENTIDISKQLSLIQSLYKNFWKWSVRKKYKILHSIFEYVVFDKWKVVSYKFKPLFELISKARGKKNKKSSTLWDDTSESIKTEVELTETQCDTGDLGNEPNRDNDGSATENRTPVPGMRIPCPNH